jgi:GT2 family glycosyltransferase
MNSTKAKPAEKFISVIIITFGRREELKDCLNSVLMQDSKNFEIILIDNNVSEDLSSRASQIANSVSSNTVRYIKPPTNLGVAGGRNLGVKEAKGDFLVFIDDDAFLRERDAFRKIRQEFSKNNKVGIISFKVINYFSKEVDRKELPHRNKSLSKDSKFETTYFIGAGHVIRKSVFDQVGLYPDGFFYGMEELDLSFRALDSGYKIFYVPDITVFHKKSLEGRLKNKDVWQKQLENRIRVSIRNLPWRYAVGNAIIWSIFVFLETRGGFGIVLKSIFRVTKSIRRLRRERRVIKPQTVQKVKLLKGRLWY